MKSPPASDWWRGSNWTTSVFIKEVKPKVKPALGLKPVDQTKCWQDEKEANACQRILSIYKCPRLNIKLFNTCTKFTFHNIVPVIIPPESIKVIGLYPAAVCVSIFQVDLLLSDTHDNYKNKVAWVSILFSLGGCNCTISTPEFVLLICYSGY